MKIDRDEDTTITLSEDEVNDLLYILNSSDISKILQGIKDNINDCDPNDQEQIDIWEQRIKEVATLHAQLLML